jgi:signal transduction histidine kinase
VEARAEAGRLIAAVSGDFEALLSGLERECQHVRAALHEGHASDEALESLARAAQPGRALTRMLRAFSRHEVRRAQTLDLNQAIDQMRSALTRLLDEDVELEVNLAPDAGSVAIDAVQLELVLVNIVGMLRAELPTGGRVILTTSPAVANDPVACRLTLAATRWRRDIPIPELASDRWLTPSTSNAAHTAHLGGVLKASGGWVDVSGNTAERLVFKIGLADA